MYANALDIRRQRRVLNLRRLSVVCFAPSCAYHNIMHICIIAISNHFCLVSGDVAWSFCMLEFSEIIDYASDGIIC